MIARFFVRLAHLTDHQRLAITVITGAAAELLLFLISEARTRKLSGVNLKAMIPNALPSAL